MKNCPIALASAGWQTQIRVSKAPCGFSFPTERIYQMGWIFKKLWQRF